MIGIISASLPGLAPLVRRWYQTVGSRKESSGGEPGPSFEYSNRPTIYSHKGPAGSDIQGMHGLYIPMDDMISYTQRSEHHDTTPLSPTRDII